MDNADDERDPEKHALEDGEEYYVPPHHQKRKNTKKRKQKEQQHQQPTNVFPPSTMNRASHTLTDSVSYYNLGATFVSFYNHVTRGTSLAPIFDSKQETL